MLDRFTLGYDPDRKLLVTLERDETGMIVAECPSMPLTIAVREVEVAV